VKDERTVVLWECISDSNHNCLEEGPTEQQRLRVRCDLAG
jgi:hypothetical protein